ncbi:MAG: transcription termination factor NusA [Simkaniaceae bacterium]|nr:transcription termination factor NusA [Simkaniaceae bacterium]
MNKELLAIFEHLEREKGIKREVIVEAITESLQSAARKSLSGAGTISVNIDPRTGEIEVIAEKEIVEKVDYPDEEILLEEARLLDPECKPGQFIQVIVTPADFGRIAAQTAKHVIAQRLRSAERDVIYEEYRHRVGELVSGTVKRVIGGATAIVDLGKVEAILPERLCPMNEKHHVGERIQALLLEVKDTDRGGAEVVLSRSHPEMVAELFTQEVPELHEETVSIKKIVRKAGYRTKLAVASNDPKVDPLGACVGVRGTRVKNVIRELNNEKIDIVIYTEDPVEQLRSLMNPIEPKKLRIDNATNTVFAVVEDEDYPIIIGKKGMNTRLNGELIGCEIEVKKMSEYQALLSFEKKQLYLEEDPQLDVTFDEIEGVSRFIVDSLKESGFDTPRKVFNAPIEELTKKTGISTEMAHDIMEKIHKMRT